jgi:hypothetical protein
MTDQNFYTVAIYMEDRAFGGHEEGGWYYDTAELCMEPEAAQYLRGFDDEGEAYTYATDLHNILTKWNEGRPETSSVLSEGRYAAIVSEGMPKPYYPETRPHYE